jgi:hypothetical protein
VPPELSVTVRVDVVGPAAVVGEKMTPTRQLPPLKVDVGAAKDKDGLHVVSAGETVKPLFAGILKPVMVSGTPPMFLIWVCITFPLVPTGVLGKASVAGERTACGAIPWPESGTSCVAPVTPPELSVMVRVDTVRPVLVVGEKMTPTRQLPPAKVDVGAAKDKDGLHVVSAAETVKPLFAGILKPVMVSGAPPMFLIWVCTTFALVPTGVSGKVRGFGARTACAVAEVPVPDRANVTGCANPLLSCTITVTVAKKGPPTAAGVKVIV